MRPAPVEIIAIPAVLGRPFQVEQLQYFGNGVCNTAEWCENDRAERARVGSDVLRSQNETSAASGGLTHFRSSGRRYDPSDDKTAL